MALNLKLEAVDKERKLDNMFGSKWNVYQNIVLKKFIAGAEILFTMDPEFENIDYSYVNKAIDEKQELSIEYNENYHLQNLTDDIKKIYDSFNELGSLNDILKDDKIDKVTEYLSKNKLSILSESKIQFKCRCNEDYIKSILRSLDEKTISDFKEDDDTFKVTCQYCGKNYIISGEI